MEWRWRHSEEEPSRTIKASCSVSHYWAACGARSYKMSFLCRKKATWQMDHPEGVACPIPPCGASYLTFGGRGKKIGRLVTKMTLLREVIFCIITVERKIGARFLDSGPCNKGRRKCFLEFSPLFFFRNTVKRTRTNWSPNAPLSLCVSISRDRIS